MIRYLLLFLLNFQSIFLFAQENNNLPGIAEVIKNFYSNYSADGLEYPHVFFEKRPEGWFIVTKKIVNNSLEDDQRKLYYNFREKKYQSLNLPTTTKVVSDISEFVDSYDLQWFKLYPYYGYNGWYKDVIQKLESEKKPTDSSLYLLARAYSVFASSLLSDQFGFSLPKETFHAPLKLNSLTSAQIQQYERICKKAINLFKQLKELNPSFETIVGKAPIKYANEEMVRFHYLMVYAPEYAKKIMLPDKLYPDSIINQVKSWMNACSRNAIFISFGDNDFYPFLYLQQHDGFRKDLCVVNYNLLGLGRYIYKYSQPLFNAEGVVFGADTNQYKNTNNDYMYLTESDTIFTVGELLDKMMKQKDHQTLELGGNTFSVKYGKNERKNNVTVGLQATVRVEGRYILKNQWILLDLIDHLNGRELNFPDELNDELKGLNNFLQWTGKVYRYKNF